MPTKQDGNQGIHGGVVEIVHSDWIRRVTNMRPVVNEEVLLRFGLFVLKEP